MRERKEGIVTRLRGRKRGKRTLVGGLGNEEVPEGGSCCVGEKTPGLDSRASSRIPFVYKNLRRDLSGPTRSG